MRISVVIPCRDAADYIASTLDSVLNQTRPADEVIVVDDGSSDGSAEIAAGFGPQIRVLHAGGEGASAARLAGLGEATGDALMFLDADDLIAPDTLASLAAVLADHPDAVAICPWQRYERIDHTVWVARPASCAPRRPDQDDLAAWLCGWYHPPCSVLWSRAAYDRSGGWDAAVPVNNDGDVMMRGFVAGNRLVLSDTGTGFYRRLPESRVSLSGTRKSPRGLASKLTVLDRLVERLDAAGRLPAYAGALSQAYRAIADDASAGHPEIAARAEASRETLPPPGNPPPHPQLLTHPGAPASLPLPRSAAAKAASAPRVSVIIPTYNRAAAVQRAIASVLGQTLEDFELLVVDDGSTDETADAIAGIDDPRLRCIRQERNKGVAAARNRGIAEARAPLLAFLDSDDEWLPRKLALQVALMESSPRHVGFVGCGVEDTLDGRTQAKPPEGRGFLFDRMLYANLLHGAGSSALVRKAAIDMVGGFDERLPAIEDYDLWIRICRFWSVEQVAEPLVRYNDAESEIGGELRRSRARGANIAARRLLHARYRQEMRRAGTEAGFLAGIAERQAAGAPRDKVAALRTLAGAIRHYPHRASLYAWLPLVLLPSGLRYRSVARLRSLRGPSRPNRP